MRAVHKRRSSGHAKHGFFDVYHLHISRRCLVEQAHHNRRNVVSAITACCPLRRKRPMTSSSSLGDLALSWSYTSARPWMSSNRTAARIMVAHMLLLWAPCHLLPIRAMHSGVKIGAILRINAARQILVRVPAPCTKASATSSSLGAFARSSFGVPTGFLLLLPEGGFEGFDCHESC